MMTPLFPRRISVALPKIFLPLVLLVGSFVAGCATLGVKDASLELEITPQPVQRGKPALAKINVPLDADSVTGTVLVMGSPQIEFKKDPDHGVWYFYGTIPFSPWVKPGNYQVRVIARWIKGAPHYTEMKVDLK